MNLIILTPHQDSQDKGRQLKHELQELENSLEPLVEELNFETSKLPNDTSSHTPVGAEEKAVVLLENRGSEIRRGESGEVYDHVRLMKEFDWADFEGASNATGEGFVYLKNDLALLELSLVQYAMKRAAKSGFTPVTSPEVVRFGVFSLFFILFRCMMTCFRAVDFAQEVKRPIPYILCKIRIILSLERPKCLLLECLRNRFSTRRNVLCPSNWRDFLILFAGRALREEDTAVASTDCISFQKWSCFVWRCRLRVRRCSTS